MKNKLLKWIIAGLLIAVFFVLGFVLNAKGVFGNKLTAEASTGLQLVKTYFGEAEYDGVLAGEGENSVLQYRTGDWLVQTDASGDRILSIALTPEAAKKAQDNQQSELTEKELIDTATSEFGKYVDVKYYVETEISREGEMVDVSLREMKDGRETGAKGYFSYYPDGTLFCFSFADRVTDFPENETLMDVNEAYDRAYELLKADRPDLEIKYDPDNMNFSQFMTAKGQMYSFDFYGGTSEHPDWDVYCNAVVYAVTGEKNYLAYEDR